MTIITVTAPGGFKHGRKHFQQGGVYDVPAAAAGLFLGVGWAREAKSEERSDAEAVDAETLGPDAPANRLEDGGTLKVSGGRAAGRSKRR